jgi:hypothetical protein
MVLVLEGMFDVIVNIVNGAIVSDDISFKDRFGAKHVLFTMLYVRMHDSESIRKTDMPKVVLS